MTGTPRRSAWGRALELAAATPPTRKREIDFLRAVAILAVVFGHWLVAASTLVDGRLVHDHALSFAPWTRGLTWVFQVMPIFFFVGGYANLTSRRAAERDGKPFSAWLQGRLARLAGPLVPLLSVWTLIAFGAHLAGVDPAWVGRASQLALVPVWFLAIYVLIVLTTPLAVRLWDRFGWGFPAACVVLVAALDFGFFRGVTWPSWTNYLFVWTAVHALGYAWREGRVPKPAAGAWIALGSFAALFLLVRYGPYPVAMVGVPGDPVSNTLPPKLPMLGLAGMQFGFVLAVEGALARGLAKRGPWALTILINGRIMTLFLWHMTAWIVMTWCAASWLGGFGLRETPGGAAWWAFRPVWMLCLVAALIPFLLVFGRFERGGPSGATRSGWALAAATAALAWGLAWIALRGVAGPHFGIRWDAALPPLLAAWWIARPFARASPSRD